MFKPGLILLGILVFGGVVVMVESTSVWITCRGSGRRQTATITTTMTPEYPLDEPAAATVVIDYVYEEDGGGTGGEETATMISEYFPEPCEGKENGTLVQNLLDCSTYYACPSGEVLTCASPLLFDEDQQSCNDADKVKCKER